MQDLLWSLKFLDLNFNDHFHYKVRYFTENLGVGQREKSAPLALQDADILY